MQEIEVRKIIANDFKDIRMRYETKLAKKYNAIIIVKLLNTVT